MVRVAIAQIKVTNNTWNNYKTLVKNIKLASKKKADIICFPETSLVHSNEKKEIQSIPFNQYLTKIQEACQHFKVHCVFGTKLPEKNKIYNVSYPFRVF